MSGNKTFRFPLDGKKFDNKHSLYEHIERSYGNLLSDEMPASRLFFNLKYKKTNGRCVMTGKPTKWNNTTERYERFADEKAADAYREMFKKRMLSKYGKTHILNEPEQQKKMLDNRKITTDYKWEDGSVSRVTSKYERDFLEMLESTYGFTQQALSEPPTLYYSLSKDQTAFYLPDFYIPSMNLIIEIKGSNPHYQQRDSHKENLKGSSATKDGFEFLQINDMNYLEFHRYFLENVLSS